jgi:hypothetical protein
MFGAAISGAFGGGSAGGNGQPQFDMAGWRAQGGSLFDAKGMMEFSNNQNAAQQGGVGAANSGPNVPMSDSYNAAASSPVFPPAAQDQAAAVFGSNDERQGSTSGFKQELKEKIIGDLNSL